MLAIDTAVAKMAIGAGIGEVASTGTVVTADDYKWSK